MGEDT
jgi:hypothetical protein